LGGLQDAQADDQTMLMAISFKGLAVEPLSDLTIPLRVVEEATLREVSRQLAANGPRLRL
jgi:hypothetical protein